MPPDDSTSDEASSTCGVSPDGASDDSADSDVCTYHSGDLDFDPDDRDRPLLVWDGDCGFCARSVERVRDQVGERVQYAPYQKIHAHVDDLGPSDFEEAVHLVQPDGTHCRAAEAIFRTLSLAPGHGYWLWLYEHVPGFAPLTEWGYRWVAENRPTASTIATWVIGSDLKPSKRHLARWLFLRLLGVVFVVAFLSFGLQIEGLLGSEGILPAVERLERIQQSVAQRHPNDFVWMWVPTIFTWIEPTERVLTGACLTGGLLGGLLVVGVWPRLVSVLLWGTYLSLVQVGGIFWGYQWDMLLLETSLMAVFLAPSGFFPKGGDDRPSGVALFLCYWLLFRLMFMSGMVKVLSGDPTWHDGTALTDHFWTQPLPTWTGYYVHHLPDSFLVVGTWGALALELGIPFFIFGPRWLQRGAAFSMGTLQVAILATGNYCFFNILTLALCLLLIDDRDWRQWLPAGLVARLEPDDDTAPRNLARARPIRRYGRRMRHLAMAAAVVGIVGITGLNMTNRFLNMTGHEGVLERLASESETERSGAEEASAVGTLQSWVDWIGRWRTLNNYGLFASMTTDRPELIVQGSRDGETWKTYHFKWKPDELDERPAFVEPHQPRLDWQMCFQALRQQRAHEQAERCGAQQWFWSFQRRLLEGSEPVESLLERVPFDEPPRYVRAVMYRYEYTNPTDDTDDWWTRTRLGQYCPTVTLQNGQLEPVR